jgi:hypothetical protein
VRKLADVDKRDYHALKMRPRGVEVIVGFAVSDARKQLVVIAEDLAYISLFL